MKRRLSAPGTLGGGAEARADFHRRQDVAALFRSEGSELDTTYHTVGTTQGGKHPVPQEMILFYLLMDVTVCPEIPSVK